MNRLLASLVVLGLSFPCLSARAETPVEGGPHTPAQLYEPSWPGPSARTVELDAHCSNLGQRYPFSCGQGALQVMGGYYRMSSLGPSGPQFDYAPFAVRVGIMASDVQFDDHWFRGCGELLLEVNGSAALGEFGTYLTGPNLILRYNFVQPDWLIIPYLQCGAGFVFTDAHQTPASRQHLIGQAFEFLLRAEVGARWMLTECVSVDAEVGYQHISNAALAERNGGVNNLGFALGFTYFFGRVR